MHAMMDALRGAARTAEMPGKLRILLVAYCFPPMNSIASHRPYGWARAWSDLGHEIHVLTPAKRAYDGPMDLDWHLAGIGIHETGLLSRHGDAPRAPSARAPAEVRRWEWLKSVTRRARLSLAMFGDPRLLAYFALVREGTRLMRSQAFDLIVATSPPEVSFFAARTLSRRTGVPWVADFRDLWFKELRFHQSGIASRLSGVVQRWLVRSAAALVTVSAGLQKRLSEYLGREVLISYNGPFESPPPDSAPPPRPWPGNGIHLVYTGRVYRGKQDPEPLLRALAALERDADRAARAVSVDFYGHDEAWLRSLVERYGLGDRVRFHGFVSHGESLAVQRAADAVLFFDWTDADAEGMLTGKLFEYLGCGRPVVALGRRADTEAAALIAETRCGTMLASEEEITGFLKKLAAGAPLPPVDPSAGRHYSRATQARAILEALRARLAIPAGGGAR
jgi:glycosyltransferase involved in cell wall biosynthesis